MELGGLGYLTPSRTLKMKRPASDGGCKENMTLAWHYAVIGRESFCMSVSVLSQVYEMTMLETNCSEKIIAEWAIESQWCVSGI